MDDQTREWAVKQAVTILRNADVVTNANEPSLTLLCREITRAADTREKRAALGKLAELLKQAWVGAL